MNGGPPWVAEAEKMLGKPTGEPTADHELTVLAVCFAGLRTLDRETQLRVLGWLNERLTAEETQARAAAADAAARL